MSSGLLQVFVELRNLIESTGVACSDSVSHNWVQVLRKKKSEYEHR